MRYTSTLETARKSKQCRFCTKSWNEGDSVWIVRDTVRGSFEMACSESCGLSGIQKISESVENLLEDVYTALNKLKERLR
jgi:hypothetical protein